MNDYLKSIVKIQNNYIEKNLILPFDLKKTGQGKGSGVFIDKKGHILTAAHVVENAIKIWVTIPSKNDDSSQIYIAKIVCVYPFFDIAILQIKNYKNKHYLKIGNSDKMNLRDKVFNIGFPLVAKNPIISSGTLSGFTEIDGNYFMQCDTVTNPGCSGGPVLNEKKQIIGITSATVGESEGSGLIIPSNLISLHLKEMIKCEKKIMYRNGLALYHINTNKSMLEFIGCKKNGILIKYISNKSPLYKKISIGDILCSISINKKKYEITKYGTVSVPWSVGKIDYDHLLDRISPNKQITLEFFNTKKKKLEKINTKLKSTFHTDYIIDKFYPIDSLQFQKDYTIFAGMVFMPLVTNHFEYKEFLILLPYIFGDGPFVKEEILIVNHIFSISSAYEKEDFSAKTILTKVNNIKVKNMKDLMKQLKKPIIKNNKKYFLFENHKKNKLTLSESEVNNDNYKIFELLGLKFE